MYTWPPWHWYSLWWSLLLLVLASTLEDTSSISPTILGCRRSPGPGYTPNHAHQPTSLQLGPDKQTLMHLGGSAESPSGLAQRKPRPRRPKTTPRDQDSALWGTASLWTLWPPSQPACRLFPPVVSRASHEGGVASSGPHPQRISLVWLRAPTYPEWPRFATWVGWLKWWRISAQSVEWGARLWAC